MDRNTGNRSEELAADIRRQFGTEATTRFLRTLPAFRTEADIPPVSGTCSTGWTA
ncbi:hypothetical protein [Mesorhizobium sp. M0025]|uniref:hypothetical protein n=1 Tax=Mesorhizobium sp. M0025 TaxID=2956846 RepID=UPI00333BFA42